MTTLSPRRVTNEELAHLWPTVGPMLDRALRHGDRNMVLVDVLYRLLAGEQHLWVFEDADATMATDLPESGNAVVAVITTQILSYPRVKVLALNLIAGERLEEWIVHEGALAEWGIAQGCQFMEGYARQGWQRRVPAGWYPCYTVIRKEIGGRDGR